MDHWYHEQAMDIYTLTSPGGRPSQLQGGQETRLYDAMEDLGGGPVSLDQIIKQCKYRRYESLLKTETIENSIAWHLRHWVRRGIVEKATSSSE
jgi:hypothetical protein